MSRAESCLSIGLPELAAQQLCYLANQQPYAATRLPPDAGKTLEKVFRVGWLAARQILGLRSRNPAAPEGSLRWLWQRQ